MVQLTDPCDGAAFAVAQTTGIAGNTLKVTAKAPLSVTFVTLGVRIAASLGRCLYCASRYP